MTNAQRQYHQLFTLRLDNGQQLKVCSYEHQTSYIVSDTPNRGGTMYLIQKASHTPEEAIEQLFKELVMDDREAAINYYNLVSGFFIYYFSGDEEGKFKATLTSRWHGLFLHVDLERRPGLDGSLMFFHIHDKEVMASLQTHPIVYILAKDQ
jgi:hypothetical protein